MFLPLLLLHSLDALFILDPFFLFDLVRSSPLIVALGSHPHLNSLVHHFNLIFWVSVGLGVISSLCNTTFVCIFAVAMPRKSQPISIRVHCHQARSVTIL